MITPTPTKTKHTGYGPPQRQALSKAPPGSGKVSPQEFDDKLEEIDRALRIGARVCADALAKAARYFQSEELWAIGSLPNCSEPIQDLEANAKRLLTDSKVSSREIEFITAGLKSMYDLRVAARCARDVVRLAWCLREEGVETTAYPIVRPVSDSAVPLAVQTAAALECEDMQAEKAAAVLYRHVDVARGQAEHTLLQHQVGDFVLDTVVGLDDGQRRATRAAVLFLAIGSECLARVSARRLALAAA